MLFQWWKKQIVKEIVHILIASSSHSKLKGGALKEMDNCARRTATEQLKFSWIHQVKYFHVFAKKLFLRMTKWPRNPQKFTPMKIKTYMVMQLLTTNVWEGTY